MRTGRERPDTVIRERMEKATRTHEDQMDFILDVMINLLARRIGVYMLGLLSGGRFKGEGGFAWGWAVAVGDLVLFAPFAAFIAGLIYIGGRVAGKRRMAAGMQAQAFAGHGEHLVTLLAKTCFDAFADRTRGQGCPCQSGSATAGTCPD